MPKKIIAILLLTVMCLITLTNCYPSVQRTDYFLRRPLRYFYKKLELKMEVNPLLSHLLQTDSSECSSKLGPFCKFVNGRNLKDAYIKNIPEDHAIALQTIKLSLDEIREIGWKIQKQKVDVFLIPNEIYKSYDTYIKTVIDNEFKEENGKIYRTRVGSRYDDFMAGVEQKAPQIETM